MDKWRGGHLRLAALPVGATGGATALAFDLADDEVHVQQFASAAITNVRRDCTEIQTAPVCSHSPKLL